MLTHEEFVSGLQADLMSPPDSVLPLHHILRITHREDQMMSRDLDLSGNHWNLQSVAFTADAYADDYVIGVSSSAFGRAQFVELEIPTQGRRRVKMADLEDQDPASGVQNYPGGTSIRALGVSIADDVEVAIYRKGTEIHARVSPYPLEPLTFIVYHSIGMISTPRLATGPVSTKAASAFWDMLHSRVLLQCITYCTHIPPEQRAEIKADHKERLYHPTNGCLAQWNKYRRQDTGEQDFIADGFSLGHRRRGGL